MGRAGRAAGILLALLLAVLVSNCADRAPAVRAASGERVWSVQLHVHGSFSEMTGSMDSHTFEAGELGLDVLWWSDHDFRITSYRQPSRFSFDATEEAFGPDERWPVLDRGGTKRLFREPVERRAKGTGRVTRELAREGSGSLRIEAEARPGEAGTSRLMFRPAAFRDGFRRPLAAGVTLRLAVRPGPGGGGGGPVIDVALSEHAPREGLGLEPYFLRYFAGGPDAEARRVGATYHVPLVLAAGEWNQVELPITRDAARGFPFALGEDNSLNRITVGVEVPAGGRTEAHFDDLRIEQELAGPELFRRQRELMNALLRARPKPIQHQGVEVSYASQHLNEFSVETALLDYDALAREVEEHLGTGGDVEAVEAYVTRRAVEEIHARGGLVSYNHMFGTALAGGEKTLGRRDVLEQLAGSRVHGCDLLEVGYRDRGGHSLDNHLWVWDQLGARGQFPVGIGVSDSHGGPTGRWRTSPNNFVSWIRAPGPDKPSLIEGLRAGRVFFGDLVLFDGTLELTSARGFRMGQVVVTDRDAAEVQLRLGGLSGGERVTAVESGRRARTWEARGAELEATHALRLEGGPGSVRFEVFGAGGRAQVFSNPIHYVREVPEGVPAERLGIDVAGVRVLALRAFEVSRLERLEGALRIVGEARPGAAGSLRLRTEGDPASLGVELSGLTGAVTEDGGEIVIEGLRGSGALVLRP